MAKIIQKIDEKFSEMVHMLKKLVTAALSIILSYYIAILLHEWGHGAIAWLFGYKRSFLDVNYGGWMLMHVDENVPYDQIIAAGHGIFAALIGIAGLSVSIILFLISLALMKKIKRSEKLYSFFYWFAVFNMVPIIQYLTVQTFSSQGDVGQFTHGLKISPWWIFIPGVLFATLALYTLLKLALPKAYKLLHIQTNLGQRIFLLVSLSIMFLLIYTHGYNPLSDTGMPFFGKILAVFSILLVPLLFLFCSSSKRWTRR